MCLPVDFVSYNTEIKSSTSLRETGWNEKGVSVMYLGSIFFTFGWFLYLLTKHQYQLDKFSWYFAYSRGFLGIQRFQDGFDFLRCYLRTPKSCIPVFMDFYNTRLIPVATKNRI